MFLEAHEYMISASVKNLAALFTVHASDQANTEDTACLGFRQTPDSGQLQQFAKCRVGSSAQTHLMSVCSCNTLFAMRCVKHIQRSWKTEYCNSTADPELRQPDSEYQYS